MMKSSFKILPQHIGQSLQICMKLAAVTFSLMIVPGECSVIRSIGMTDKMLRPNSRKLRKNISV